MINVDQFYQIAGESEDWDDQVIRLVKGGVSSLSTVQECQFENGRRSAEIIFGHGSWMVRSTSSLNDSKIYYTAVMGGLNGFYQCVEYGKYWVAEAPYQRELIVRISNIPRGAELMVTEDANV